MSSGQKIAIYARVSSDRQVQDCTVDSQLEAVREFAETLGFAVDPDLLFVDNGVSGATFVRPALDALRDLAAAAEVDAVVIHTPEILELDADGRGRLAP